MPDTTNKLDQKSKLSQAKRALLERRLRGHPKLGPAPKAIAKQSKASAQLSFSQQRLWFLEQLGGANVAYNVPTALSLKGRLDIPALEWAVNAIIRRHEILRTRFEQLDGEPAQIIAPELRLPVGIHDLSGLSGTERDNEVIRLAQQDGGKPFDLVKGPLLRVSLLVLGADEYVLLFTLHHIVFDGWSAAILFEEFAGFYRAFLAGEAAPLPPLTIQYADFAEWQRDWLRGERLDQQLAYWRKQLDGVPPLLELPTDHPRPSVQGGRGATYPFLIQPDLAGRLHGLCREQGVTLFVALVSLFNVLLHRYSGQADFCLGASVANRSRPELEGLIGLFSNMLVLRADCADNPTFIEFMARMQSVSVGAQEHQDLPFEKLVEELNPPRDRSYSPYFQVILILHNMPSGNWEVPGLQVRNLGLDFGTAKSDLALHITEEGGGMEAAFEYSSDLFERPSIARMAGHFTALLEAIVAHPDCPISDLPLLTPAEQRDLAAWSDAGDSTTEAALLHELFEAQARQHPQRVALTCGGQSLCYAELDARANTLAEGLRRRGVGPEIRVGLCMERSAEAIVAMLAILKAGGAYVPLDPGYPPERLAELLADSAAALLLSQTKLAARLPSTLPTVYLDEDAAIAGVADETAAPPAVPASSHQAAYLIYTSGSTGKPKGVVVSHANAVASTAARFAYYAEPVDCFLLLSPFAFDSSVAGIFWALGQGGRLCVSPEGSQQDPRTLLQIIERERPSHLLCLPSLHGLLLDCARPAQMQALRDVIVAGETCAPALAAQHFKHLPNTRLHNEYGPTEATVWSSVHPVQPGDGQADRPVSIGKPIAGARLRLLDRRLNPVPVGVPGEIYVGGAGVARGYHRRPGLTAERFVPDPFGAPGQRLYRTGDLARWREDGSVEFLGRADGQVKIRGFRVELGEIEARLLRHPQVKDAAATIREDLLGDFRIVAYVVLSAPDAQAGLREFLKASLPDYMVPSAFVALERLPLTLTGKLDRNALPKPDITAQLAGCYSAPQNTLEQQLCGIWAELLGVAQVGVHDNFFDLGGHSLSAVQVVTRIEDRLGLEMSVADLFDAPTVAELAQVLAQQTAGQPTDELEAILRELQHLPTGEAEALLASLSD